MTILERLAEDLKKAQKEKQELRLSVLRMTLSSLNNKQIEKRTKLSKSEPLEKLDELSQLTETEILDVFSAEAKKRKEAIEGFKAGNRPDSAAKETEELKILQEYLPQQLSEEELRNLVKEAVARTGAKTVADLGKVMQELMPKVKGRADGGLLNKLVREHLS